MCQNKQPNKRCDKKGERGKEKRGEKSWAERAGQRDFLTNFYDTFHFMTPGELYVLRSANFKVDFSFRHFLSDFFLPALFDFYRLKGAATTTAHSPQCTPPMTIKNNKCQKLLLSLAL